MTTTSVSCHED